MLNHMTIEAILAEIDSEIERLTEARRLLATAGSTSTKATATKRSAKKSPAKARKPRVLSAEARKRIADATRDAHRVEVFQHLDRQVAADA